MGGGGMKNIGGSTDQFYRYKMPGLQRKVCGRGNGIKTQLVNCAMVARALHRPAGYVCKFFGCELGAQTKIDDNTSMYIVNGAHELDVLEEILARFVRMFVLCSNCDLPETDLTVDRKGTIKQVCKACGCNAMVDMTHKLCTYIANNPPDGTAAAKAKGRKKESQKERRLRKAREAVGLLLVPVDEERDELKKQQRRDLAILNGRVRGQLSEAALAAGLVAGDASGGPGGGPSSPAAGAGHAAYGVVDHPPPGRALAGNRPKAPIGWEAAAARAAGPRPTALAAAAIGGCVASPSGGSSVTSASSPRAAPSTGCSGRRVAARRRCSTRCFARPVVDVSAWSSTTSVNSASTHR